MQGISMHVYEIVGLFWMTNFDANASYRHSLTTTKQGALA